MNLQKGCCVLKSAALTWRKSCMTITFSSGSECVVVCGTRCAPAASRWCLRSWKCASTISPSRDCSRAACFGMDLTPCTSCCWGAGPNGGSNTRLEAVAFASDDWVGSFGVWHSPGFDAIAGNRTGELAGDADEFAEILDSDQRRGERLLAAGRLLLPSKLCCTILVTSMTVHRYANSRS